jgi:hypothetical protein
MSCEGAPPEIGLQDFQFWDARVSLCPLYSFLFHEYANGMQGFYTNRVSDEALRASLARAIVTGYMMIMTLRDKGLIEYDWDQTWSRAIPDQQAIYDWTKRLNQFRAGVAKDYLIYGRMLRPWAVTNVTDLGESPRVELQGEGEKNVTLYLDGQKSERTLHLPTVIDLEMEPRSIALIEVK